MRVGGWSRRDWEREGKKVSLTNRFNSNRTHRRTRLFISAGFGFEGAGAGCWVFGELFHFFEALDRASVADILSCTEERGGQGHREGEIRGGE